MLAFFYSYSSQYQESISFKPGRIFVLLSKSLDQFTPFYALSFQLSWHTPTSFFNVKIIADGHFPRISLSFLSQLVFLFMSISSPSLNPSGYKYSLPIGSRATCPRSAISCTTLSTLYLYLTFSIITFLFPFLYLTLFLLSSSFLVTFLPLLANSFFFIQFCKMSVKFAIGSKGETKMHVLFSICKNWVIDA